MIVFTLSVALALGVSFLCSLAEASLLSITPSQSAEVTARHPSLGSVWQKLTSNIDRPIALILVVNTAAHTIGASVAGAEFDNIFGDEWIWLFSLVFTFAMLQFAEILPKSLGVRFNRELAFLLARPLYAAIRTTKPVIDLLRWINRPFELKGGSNPRSATLEEIAALAAFARLSKQIGPHQERIIKAASRLSQLRVEQVMIPIEQVSFLSTAQSLNEAVLAAHIDSHTRFPVCEDGDRDRVVGYVNFKEMIYYMRTNPKDPSFRGIIRPMYAASPSQSVAELLKIITEQHIHIAIVRNEAGASIGLVTMEDVIEELVGELEDEFDRLPRMMHALSGDTYMIGGGVPMAELAQRLGVPVSPPQGTVAYWLAAKLDKAPRPGDVHREDSLEFLVRRVRRGKVFEVSVTRSPAAATP